MTKWIGKLATTMAAICFLANIILGCAIVMPMSGKALAQAPDASVSASVAMTGCHDTSPKEGTLGQTSFCKAFCASLACTPSQNFTSVASSNVAEVRFLTRDAPWHSGVDPPHPRSFQV